MSAASPTTAVSSSSTLWATPSKDWVIPAKPKPGRKPKKDIAPPLQDSTETDTKERRVQNRAAQRAFRERKQTQLAELQARVQQYEQGEVERNVALQQIAKKLKEENETLRTENKLLKDKVAELTQSLSLHDLAKKRSRDESGPHPPGLPVDHYPKKKAKVTPDPPTYASSPSSTVSSPGSSHTSYSPIPMSASQDASFANSLDGVFDMSQNGKGDIFDSSTLRTCGFCSEDTPCVCREIALEQASERMSLSDHQSQGVETKEHQASPSLYSMPAQLPSPAAPAQSSILDNLPQYQPPVPLRRRSPNPVFNSIFPIQLASAEPQRSDVASCSGDPSNCMACADDAFGKAFCTAISQSVASTSCGNCPEHELQPTVNGCCGNAAFCGQTGCGPAASSTMSSSAAGDASMMMANALYTSETVPCDTAWRQIKSHPNVAFTDLSLLAEVVARRSKCNGPKVEILPALGSITPERGLSPHSNGASGQPHHADTNAQSLMVADPHAQYQERQQGRSPPPQLVPQDVLISCGRRYRVREVKADGVREALRLLDAKFSVP
ncbi:hypothetical protein B0H21DRAFT_788892 [Amylocystis lapponica]|nr:hypothetical protein B0H21DRAFT_788892 [Amylocystis lapponica]